VNGPNKAVLIPLLVCGPAALATLSECLYHDIHSNMLVHSRIGPILLPWGSAILAASLSSLLVPLAVGARRDGIYAIAVGYVFAEFMIFNFRGSIHWSGIFDLADRSMAPFVLWPLFSLLLGIVYAKAHPRLNRQRSSNTLVTVSIVGLAYAWTQYLIGDDVRSSFPLTRPFALSILFAICCVTVAVTHFYSPDFFEDLEQGGAWS
jgi:hypothetical protein